MVHKETKSERQMKLIPVISVVVLWIRFRIWIPNTMLLTLSDPECGAGQDDLLWCASCGEGYNQEVLAAEVSPSTPAACSKCGRVLEHSKVPYDSRRTLKVFAPT
jgi:hypothetical protein